MKLNQPANRLSQGDLIFQSNLYLFLCALYPL